MTSIRLFCKSSGMTSRYSRRVFIFISSMSLIPEWTTMDFGLPQCRATPRQPCRLNRPTAIVHFSSNRIFQREATGETIEQVVLVKSVNYADSEGRASNSRILVRTPTQPAVASPKTAVRALHETYAHLRTHHVPMTLRHRTHRTPSSPARSSLYWPQSEK